MCTFYSSGSLALLVNISSYVALISSGFNSVVVTKLMSSANTSETLQLSILKPSTHEVNVQTHGLLDWIKKLELSS